MTTESISEPKTTFNAQTYDLTEVRVVIKALIMGLNSGPKSRERSLVVTKLQEAEMWALEAMARE